jgi:hypothetical protein
LCFSVTDTAASKNCNSLPSSFADKHWTAAIRYAFFSSHFRDSAIGRSKGNSQKEESLDCCYGPLYHLLAPFSEREYQERKKPGASISKDISATRLSQGDPEGFPPHPRGWLSIIVYLVLCDSS